MCLSSIRHNTMYNPVLCLWELVVPQCWALWCLLSLHAATSPCPLFFQMDLQRLLDWQRFTQAQLRALAQQRQRDREELLARALVTLQEARHAHQEELEHHRDCQHQQDICSHLREKVSVCLTGPGSVYFPFLNGAVYLLYYAATPPVL